MANRVQESGKDRNFKYTDDEIRVMREFSMVEFMRLHGASIEHNGRMYSSPWRDDKNKSLEITDSRHVWHDFGDTDPSHMKKNPATGTMYAGGDTIDFVRVYRGLSTRGEAMDYLASIMPGFIRSSSSRQDSSRRLRGPLSGYTCHTADPTTGWSELLSRHGVWIEQHRSGLDKNGEPYMNAEQLDDAATHIDLANETLQRRPDKFMEPLSRYWSQVSKADAVFVIGRFAVGSESVLDGSAAWPAQMARDAGKAVYLYELDRKRFFRCDDESSHEWAPMDAVPSFARSFALVAPRTTTPEIEAAIRVCINKTAGMKAAAKEAPAGKTASVESPATERAPFSDPESRPFSYGMYHFDNVVQFVQWSKAVRFGAQDIADAVLSATTPEEAWSVGEKLQDYDKAVWNAIIPEVRETGIRVSFLSNPEAAQALVDADVAEVMQDGVLAKVREEFKANMVGTSMDGQGAAHYVIDEVRQGVSFTPNRKYMEEVRHIGRAQLSRYCADVKIHKESVKDGELVKGNSFIAVGFPNKSHGFELRKDSFVNASGETVEGMKKCTSKDFTVISGDGRFLTDPLSPTTPSVLVFEGFVDFLAYLCWNGIETPGADTVILNSTSMVSSSVPFIASHGRVCAYLDNDKSGENATQTLRAAVEEIAAKEGRQVFFTDGSPAYEGYKDVSEAYSDMLEKSDQQEV